MENTSSECAESIASAAEFLAGFEHFHELIVLLIPIAFCFMTLTLYVISIRAVIAHGAKDTKGNVASLFTIYPVSAFKLSGRSRLTGAQLIFQIVACTSLISILVPKTYFFCDTIAHISFVIISYQFYR